MGDTAGPGDRSGLPGSTAAEPSSAAWVGEGLRWRLRHSPRLSRLVTAIELFAPELEARRPAAGRPQDPTSWTAVADEHLRLARAAANDRRLDDGWDFLHSAQRQTLNALTRAEAADAVVALEREAAA
ncbi:MAG: hypothetical protein HY830_01780, partial [Actinobacteria bacterium]|nr:hypothetical protein [Actinomycetota bacterium]